MLGWFLSLLYTKDPLAEMLVLNPSTPDDAVAEVARTCSAKIAEIIGQNQLRVLRSEFGNDAFLKEDAAVARLLRESLGDLA